MAARKFLRLVDQDKPCDTKQYKKQPSTSTVSMLILNYLFWQDVKQLFSCFIDRPTATAATGAAAAPPRDPTQSCANEGKKADTNNHVDVLSLSYLSLKSCLLAKFY